MPASITLITDWRPIEDWLKIWEGGLGIPGGLIGGIGVGYLVAKRRLADTDNDLSNMLDAAIPGIPVAQAIGRLGNWFNQEIFGGPSDLPWAVEIDPAYRPAEFAESTYVPSGVSLRGDLERPPCRFPDLDRPSWRPQAGYDPASVCGRLRRRSLSHRGHSHGCGH